MTIRVLVADDQPLMRSALRMCLAAEPDIDVVGEAEDGRQAVSIAERMRPDAAIIDIRMPHLDGVAATRGVDTGTVTRAMTSPSNPHPTKVLLMTTFHLDEYVVEGLRAGAMGFLLKDATSDEVVHAVRVVASGSALLSPTVTKRLLENYAHRLPVAGHGTAELALLTKREVAVLTLVAQGLSNAEIGNALHVAESSVKTHVSHLLAKLELRHRVQLVIFAYDTGLVWPGATIPAVGLSVV